MNKIIIIPTIITINNQLVSIHRIKYIITSLFTFNNVSIYESNGSDAEMSITKKQNNKNINQLQQLNDDEPQFYKQTHQMVQ